MVSGRGTLPYEPLLLYTWRGFCRDRIPPFRSHFLVQHHSYCTPGYSIMLRLISKWPNRFASSQIGLIHSKRSPQSLTVTSRSFASIVSLDNHPSPGEHIHGFTLKKAKTVPELQLTAFLLHHEKTGAEYLHIARDDKNNVFSIGFKTNPPDATGVPHILEHTALCGSKRYAK